MADQEQCKNQRINCEKSFSKDIKRIEERFISTDKALEVQQKELERRMHESNDIKKEFSASMIDLRVQVNTLETKSALWLKMIGFGLAILQITIGIILRISLR